MNATPPLQYDPVKIAQMFFQRTKIKGEEVEAYVQAYNWLDSLKTGEFTALPTTVLTALRVQTEAQTEVVVELRAEIKLLKAQLAETPEFIDGKFADEDVPMLEVDLEVVPDDAVPPDELEAVD